MLAVLGVILIMTGSFSLGYWAGFIEFNRTTRDFDQDDWRRFISAFPRPNIDKREAE